MPRLSAAGVLDRRCRTARSRAGDAIASKPGHRDWESARVQTQSRSPCTRRPRTELEPGPVHPARSARVPGPAAAPDVRRDRIDIRGHHIGFDLVAMHIRARGGAA